MPHAHEGRGASSAAIDGREKITGVNLLRRIGRLRKINGAKHFDQGSSRVCFFTLAVAKLKPTSRQKLARILYTWTESSMSSTCHAAELEYDYDRLSLQYRLRIVAHLARKLDLFLKPRELQFSRRKAL